MKICKKVLKKVLPSLARKYILRTRTKGIDVSVEEKKLDILNGTSLKLLKKWPNGVRDMRYWRTAWLGEAFAQNSPWFSPVLLFKSGIDRIVQNDTVCLTVLKFRKFWVRNSDNWTVRRPTWVDKILAGPKNEMRWTERSGGSTEQI